MNCYACCSSRYWCNLFLLNIGITSVRNNSYSHCIEALYFTWLDNMFTIILLSVFHSIFWWCFICFIYKISSFMNVHYALKNDAFKISYFNQYNFWCFLCHSILLTKMSSDWQKTYHFTDSLSFGYSWITVVISILYII